MNTSLITQSLPALLLIAACALPVVVAHADEAAPIKAPLDLRMPDLRSIQMQDEGLQATEPTDSQDAEDIAMDIAIVGAPPEGASYLHVSRAGIGSLYWAARHRSQAWKVLFPITPRDGSAASEDIRVSCATFARPPGGRAACP